MNDWDDKNNLPPEDDDDIFGWLDDDQDRTPSEPGDDDLSFDWEQGDSAEPSAGADDDDFRFDWEDEPAEPQPPRQEEWRMQRPTRRESEFAQSMEEAEDADIGDVESILDWMATSEEEEDPAAPAVLPDWLQGLEIPEAAEGDDTPETPEEPLSTAYDIDFGAGAAPDDDISWLENLAGAGSLRTADDDVERLGQLATGELSGEDDDFARLNQLAQTGDLEDDDDFSRLGDLATGELSEPTGDTGSFDWNLGEGFEDDEEFERFDEPAQERSAWGTTSFEEESFGDLEDFDAAAEPAASAADPWGDAASFEDEDFADWDSSGRSGMEEAPGAQPTFEDFAEDEPQQQGAVTEPDWLAGLDLPPAPEEEDESEGTLEDALAALFGPEDPEEEDSYDDIYEEEPAANLNWMQEPETGGELDDLLAELGDDDTEATSLDDLLAELGGDSTSQPSTLDDLLREMDAADVVNVDEEQFAHEPPAAEEESAPLSEEDFFGMEPEEPAAFDDDFFAVGEPGAPEEDDFFSELFAQDEDGEHPHAEEAPLAQESDVDWLRELQDADDDDVDFAEAELLDAEDWLASLGDTEAVMPVTDNLEEEYGAVDFDSELFAEEEELVAQPADNLDDLFAGFDAEADESTPVQADLPDFGGDEVPEWLREAAATSAAGTSAVSELRQQKDRPLDELDERLLDIRERGLELTTTDPAADTNLEKIQTLVPNAADALIPVQRVGTASVIAEPNLTPDQQQRAQLLRGLVTATGGTDEEAQAAERQRERQRRGGILRGYSVPRLLVALLLLAVVALPFLTQNYTLSELPPGVFAGGSQQEQAFLRVQSLMANDPVLVAVEYGATGARELDTMTQAIFSHLFNQGAVPILVSSDPVGLLNAENLAADLAGEDERGSGFVSAGYLPGGELGIRDLTVNLPSIIGSDSRGEITNLPFTSLDEFRLIVLIADNSETVRRWMEQVAPVTETDFVVATGQSAAPLAIPYVDAVNDAYGLLVGYADAYTYQSMNVAFNGEPPTPTPAPTEEAITEEPTEEAVFPADATEEAAETEDPAATEEAAETEDPAATEEPAQTEEPTRTPQPSATPTNTATPLPTNTPEPTTTPEPRQFARIITTGAVNIRSGPGTDFDVVAGAVPGEELLILGFDDSGEWVNIELPDGGDGWIATSLVEIFEETDVQQGEPERVFMRPGRQVVAQQATPAEPTVLVGTNVSGILMSVYDNPDFEGEPFADLPPNTEFLVLDEGEEVTQVLLDDGRTGWVETRLLRVEERPASQVEFAPTATFTPTITPTATNSPTPTITPSPTATPFVPQVIPQPLPDAGDRWNAMTLGTLAAIVLIFGGNVIWIIRWLRQRGK